MTMACDFLNCSEDVLLFIYLGLPMGENSTKFETWGNRYVSFGGRIILIN